MSNQNKQYEEQFDDPYAAEGTDTLANREVIERLHPSLQESFVPLPPAGTRLTPEQMEAVFAGDLRALWQIARLTYQTGKSEPEL